MNHQPNITEPDQLFHLSGAGKFTPADLPDLPDRVSDLPAFYYWKDAIAVGSYLHPAGWYSLDITRNRLDGYVANFNRMRENGIGVPILMDHTASASATLGWIMDVRRDEDRLLELHQFLGETSRDVGLRNKVSLGIDPHFVDGKGVEYGEAIVHSAVTPTPVVPDQGEWCGIGVPGGMGVPPMEEIVELRLIPPPEARIEDGGLKIEAGHGFDRPGVVDHQSVAVRALEQLAIAKRDLALSRGGVDPAVAEELFNLLAQPANLLMLSRTANGLPMALAVFDALARNRPVPIGEMTGVQVLTRQVPGDDGDDLRQRMIALANGG